MAQLDPITPEGRLYVSPQGTASAPNPIPGNASDPWATYSDTPPPAPSVAATVAGPGTGGDPWAGYSDAPPPIVPPKNDYSGAVGAVEAGGRGLMHGATMGLEPALAGASAAAEPDIEAAATKLGINPEAAKLFLTAVFPNLKPLYGAGRVAHDTLTHEPTLSEQVTGPQQTPAQAAYSKVRGDEALKNKEAYEQQPASYVGGNIVGAVAAPVPGGGALRTAAPLAERVLQGTAEGMIGGGAYGAGNAIGEGESPREVARDTATGTGFGGILGGAFGGAFGRRPPSNVQTPAQRAVNFADLELNAPLPKALSYEPGSTGQGAGAFARQMPIVGPRINTRARDTLHAAEGAVQDRVGQLTPDASRAGTDEALKGSIGTAIENNRATQDAAYTRLRGMINPDQLQPLPHTLRALQNIERRRMASGATRQQARAGLEEAWTLAERGGGFNGVHRRRALLRNPPASLRLTNPGYEAGDFNAVADAMTTDLQGVVRRSSHAPIADSLRAFQEAERTFGYLAEENSLFEKLRDASGEGTVTKVLKATKEKGGAIDTLRRLRATLPPDEFERISGTVLSEMGENKAHDFSFAQFRKSWLDLSDEARNLLFSPQHQRFIDEVVNLAEHVRDADSLRNHSNTSGSLILFEMMKTIAELGIATGAGAVGPKEFITTAGGIAAGQTFGWLMGNPARAASLSAFTRAYRAITANQPTPARVAAFRVATRNLANNIHIPYDRIVSIVEQHLPARAAQQPTQSTEPQKQ